MSDDENVKGDENLLAVPEIADAKASSALAVGSIALNMAMKFHDINTVQDGALYDAYKRDGINMRGLQLDMVFETAARIEQHLMNTSNRLSDLVYGNLIMGLAEDLPEEESAEGEP